MNILSSVDFIVALKGGQIERAGARDEILPKMRGPKVVDVTHETRAKQQPVREASHA